MFIGNLTINKNNINHLSQAFHWHYGIILINSSTVLLVSCNPSGFISGKPLKLGDFSDNVERVAWSSRTLIDVYLSVQLQSRVHIFHVYNNGDSMLQFSQIHTLTLDSRSPGCIWHINKPVVCILQTNHAFIFNTITETSQKLYCNEGRIRTGAWTSDGSKLIIAINSTLKIYSWDDFESVVLTPEIYKIKLQEIGGNIRNIVTISHKHVAIATDLPLEHLVQTSLEDKFEATTIKLDDDESLSQSNEQRDVHNELSKKDDELILSLQKTSACPVDVISKETQNRVTQHGSQAIYLLKTELNSKKKGCIDLTELLTQVTMVDSQKTVNNNLDYLNVPKDSEKFDVNACVSFETSRQSMADSQVKDVIDLMNIKATDTDQMSLQSMLKPCSKQQQYVMDSCQLLVVDLSDDEANVLAEVNVPAIINPDLLIYEPSCSCLVVGNNSQQKLLVFKWKKNILTRLTDMDLPSDEKPVGLVGMSNANVLVMSAESDEHRDSAFLYNSHYSNLNIHIKMMTIIEEDGDIAHTPDSNICEPRLQHLKLQSGNIGDNHRIIEEIDDTRNSLKMKQTPVKNVFKNYCFAHENPPVIQLVIISSGVTKSFILEERCYLKLRDVKNAFRLLEIEMQIGDYWVYLGEDCDGFAKLKFKPYASHFIRHCIE